MKLRGLAITVGVAAVLVALQAVVAADPGTITDWQAWAVGLAFRSAQAAAAAAVGYISERLTQ